MSLVLLGAVLPWVLVVVVCWLGFKLVALNGKILNQIAKTQEYVEEMMPFTPTIPQEGLPAGTVAPAFDLPELRGGQVSLEQFRGRRVLLAFSGPHCIYCERMMPDLAALPLDGRNGRPVPLVISSGTVEDNLAFFDKFGVRCSVLLYDESDLPTQYKAWSTPSGYLIDEEGMLISELAIGGEQLMDLATNPKSELIKTGAENVAFLGMPKPPGS